MLGEVASGSEPVGANGGSAGQMIHGCGIYHALYEMVGKAIGKLFKHGRYQAVRLPKQFRLPGEKVRVRWIGRAVLLEPIEFDVDEWLAKLAEYRNIPFMENGREQPPMPDDDITFD
jgi:antitoxin VapB